MLFYLKVEKIPVLLILLITLPMSLISLNFKENFNMPVLLSYIFMYV